MPENSISHLDNVLNYLTFVHDLQERMSEGAFRGCLAGPVKLQYEMFVRRSCSHTEKEKYFLVLRWRLPWASLHTYIRDPGATSCDADFQSLQVRGICFIVLLHMVRFSQLEHFPALFFHLPYPFK